MVNDGQATAWKLQIADSRLQIVGAILEQISNLQFINLKSS
jgi:hypothetical protein